MLKTYCYDTYKYFGNEYDFFQQLDGQEKKINFELNCVKLFLIRPSLKVSIYNLISEKDLKTSEYLWMPPLHATKITSVEHDKPKFQLIIYHG